jgi:general stress protein 26
MDSINKNQPEVNHENLSGSPAIDKLKDLIDKAKSCFFCTHTHAGDSNGVRPMAVQKVDEEGNIWFLSADDSHKNHEIDDEPFVKLYFQGSAHSDFLYLNGRATVSKNKQMIDELWEPVMKTWFTEGKEDPRISVIKVTPEEGYYWDTKHGMAVSAIKMLIGAATGKTLDDSIEGRLTVNNTF